MLINKVITYHFKQMVFKLVTKGKRIGGSDGMFLMARPGSDSVSLLSVLHWEELGLMRWFNYKGACDLQAF